MKTICVCTLLMLSPLSLASGISISPDGVSVGDLITIKDGQVDVGDVHVDGDNVSIGAGGVTVDSKRRHKGTQVVRDDVFFDKEGKAHDVKKKNFVNDDLTHIDLSYYDLTYTNFTNADLEHVDLTGADLTGSVFVNTDFRNVNFTGATMTDACVINTEFRDSQMVKVNLTGSAFINYTFNNVDFRGTDKGVVMWQDDAASNACDAIKEKQEFIEEQPRVSTSVVEPARVEFISSAKIVETLSQGEGMRIDLTVNFETGSDKLFGSAHAQVQEIAKALQALGEHNIIIEGHTDSKGAASYNLDLSYRRAATVLRVLTQNYGVSPAFLSIKGYGEQEPIASNTSEHGRALNRRVTLVNAP